MKSIRIGNDIRIEWPIVLSGDVSKLQDLDLTVEVRPSAKIIDTHNYADEIRNNDNKRLLFEKHETTVMMNGGLECRRDIGDGKEHCRPRPPRPCPPRPIPPAPVKLPYHIEDNTLIAMWTADRQFATGDYDIILYAHKNEGGQAVCDQYRFVRLVSHTAQADAPDDSGIEAVIAMQPVTLELSGLSAYEVAVINGFQGTEKEWLASLKKPAEDAAEELKQEIEQFKEDTKEELQADIKALGYYEDNPEFIRAYTDAEGKFLWGIRVDGTVEWAKGVPTPVQNAIRELKDKLETQDIKSLQDAIDVINASLKPLTDTFSFQDNEEFAHVIIDADGKVLFGIKTDGKPYYPNNEMYHVIQNDEYLSAWVDASNKILFGIKTDGSIYIAKSEYIDAVKEIQENLTEIEVITENFEVTDNPEFIATTVDNEGKVLEATQADGKKYFPKQALLDKYDDVEGRTEITLDAEDRVLAYRDKEGIKHEEKLALHEVYDKDNNKINLATQEDVENVTVDPSSINISELKGVSDHNTPNLLIASEMEKTFNDGKNSFTPPNAGYEMSNPIECKAGDWFTRTGTATGMVVITDENDKNGTRLFNADGTTLGNTFQVPTDMTWVRYIRMAAEVVGAENGSVVICRGKVAYTGDDRGNYLTMDKLRVQNFNLPKEVKYLKSPDGKYWELYVDDSHQLQIREIDPDIITELPADFPVYTVSGDFSEYFDTWVSMVNTYLAERNKNGVIKYNKLSANPALYAEFRKEKNLSGETRYVVGYPNSYTGPNGEQYLTIYDDNFNIIDTGIHVAGTTFDAHDFVFFDDNHVAIFFSNSKSQVQVPIDQNKSGYVTINAVSASIAELKKTNGVWNEIGRFNMYDYPELLTDEFGIYSETGVLEVHPNTLFIDYDGNYVLNIRNNDSWIKVKRTENEDGTVTIGSDTLDYNEAIIGRVGGKYNSGYIDPKRVLEEGFSFTDVPTSLHTRSTDEEPAWKFYHEHDIAYWGMKNIGGQNYPTYTLFDNNMWTDNSQTVNYIDVNPRNNYSNNPNGGSESAFLENKSDAGGAYDTHMVSRVVQLSIDWEKHLIKDYRVYIIPKQYSYTRSGAQMFDEGVLFISWADQRICGLYDFNDEQTEVENHVYKNGKELFKATVNATGLYRVHGYKSNQ